MNMTKALRQLREGFDGDVGAEVPAVLLLSDVCIALGLSEAARRDVLGSAGVQYVDDVLGGAITLKRAVPGVSRAPELA